jgi:hypothetical protein
MSKSNSNIYASLLACGGFLLIFLAVLGINFIIGSFCWPYVINSWLVYFGKNAQIFWYHGLLISCVPGIGQLALPLTVVTWLLMLFLN